MATERKAITAKIKILSLRYHGQHICPICLGYITVGDDIDWDHRHALIHNGPHDHFNIRMVHRECHKKKTKADIQANAKIKRLTGQTKGRPKTNWPSRPMESGPTKWPKRKFQTKSKAT